MNQKTRIFIAIAIIVVLTVAVIGIERIRGQRIAAEIDASLEPGDIPVFWNDSLRAAFSPTDIESLPSASFIDAEEGKTQEGWLFKDVLLTYFKEGQFIAEFTLMPQTVYGTGEKIKIATDEAVRQLSAFVDRCSDSLASGISLIPEIYNAYKYLIEE